MTTLERELRNLVPTTRDPPSQKLWLAARLELHPGRLNKRLESALSAIQHRMNALGTRYDGAPTAEHHALADAIDSIANAATPKSQASEAIGGGVCRCALPETGRVPWGT
jgi:hypothetical protein